MLRLHCCPLDLGDFANDANLARYEVLPFALRLSGQQQHTTAWRHARLWWDLACGRFRVYGLGSRVLSTRCCSAMWQSEHMLRQLATLPAGPLKLMQPQRHGGPRSRHHSLFMVYVKI